MKVSKGTLWAIYISGIATGLGVASFLSAFLVEYYILGPFGLSKQAPWHFFYCGKIMWLLLAAFVAIFISIIFVFSTIKKERKDENV